MATKYIKGKLYKLKIADLQPDPQQARTFMDTVALNELAASIEKYGILVPIQFCLNEEGGLMIVSGHRRVKAAAKAGLTEIHGTFTEGDIRLQGFVDNLQREGLTPVDEAEQMKLMMKEYAFNQYQLADALGKDRTTVTKTLSINKLPEDIRSAARTNPNIPKSVRLDAARMSTEKSMRRKFLSYMTQAAKAGQTSARKQRLSKERILITKTDNLTGELDGLPWREWAEDDRNDLASALAGIRRKADELLAEMEWNREEEEEEKPSASGMNLS